MINLTKRVSGRFPHIILNKEFFKDLKIWKAFLADWNGRSFFPNTTVPPPRKWSSIVVRRVPMATMGTLMENGSRVDGYLTCNSAEERA